MEFAFYSSFCKCAKRGRKIRKKQTKKTKPIFEVAYLGTLEAILLKFGMWATEVRGRVLSKNRLVSSRQHRATEVRKLRFRSSCQYTHGVLHAGFLGRARHTTVCLDNLKCVSAILEFELQCNNYDLYPDTYFKKYARNPAGFMGS